MPINSGLGITSISLIVVGIVSIIIGVVLYFVYRNKLTPGGKLTTAQSVAIWAAVIIGILLIIGGAIGTFVAARRPSKDIIKIIDDEALPASRRHNISAAEYPMSNSRQSIPVATYSGSAPIPNYVI